MRIEASDDKAAAMHVKKHRRWILRVRLSLGVKPRGDRITIARR
jgi:hypothetical protein